MRNALLFTTALVAAALLAAPARADEDEIVITATRAPTAESRLPARVDVIDRADIEGQAIVSLTQAIGSESVQAGGAGQQASTFLRGANSKHALALFDGVRLNDASTPNAQYDFGLDTLGAIERVEVLRGPASSIYGSDALGGVVNLIPRRGGEEAFEPFLEISGGSFGTLRGLAGAAGDWGGTEYGVSVETLHTDGFDLIPERMGTHTGERDGADIDTFTASVRHDGGVFAFDALVRARETTTEFDTFSGGAFFDLRADDPDLETDASQHLWRLGAEMEAGTALTFRLSGGQVLGDRSELDGGFETSAAKSTRDFADLTAHYDFGRIEGTAGFSFERNSIDTRPQFANPLSVDEDQTAAFVIGQVDVTEQIVATGSVRVDDYDAFGTQTTWQLGAVANFAPFRVFASYGTAFKAPSLSERYEQSFFNIGNPDLAPEESKSWEIGADWDIGDRVRVGASYYQTRIDDLINYDFFQLKNVNIDEAEIDGAEAYAEADPTSWANLRLSYAWTDARDGVTGAQLARRPEDAWRFDARFTPMERLGLALSWTYVGERTDVTYDDLGQFQSSAGRVDAYNVGAIAATFDLDEHAQVFVRVDNVTDEVYEQPAAFAGQPRSVQAGLRAKF